MKKKLTDNLILKVLSVFLAILLWMLVLNIEDPSKTRMVSGIKVSILNKDVITGNNQVYSVLEGELISVKVTGPRTIVDSLKASDFEATADLKDISQANSVPINVELKSYAKQQKVNIDNISNNSLRLQVENLIERRYEVNVNYLGVIPDGYMVEKTELACEEVTVIAPESVQEAIKEVSISVSLSNVTGDISDVYTVRVLDKSGVELLKTNADVSVDITNIKADSTIYYTKRVPVTYDEVPTSAKVSISAVSLDKESLNIKGPKEVLDTVGEVRIRTDEIMITERQDKEVYNFDLEAFLPEQVYLNEKSGKVAMTVSAQEVVQRSYTVNVADIAIKNIPDGMDASIVSTGTISIMLEGLEESLKDFSMGKIVPYVSMKGRNEGVSVIEVELQLPDGIRQSRMTTVEVSLVASKDEPAVSTTPNTRTETSIQETQESSEEHSVPQQEMTGEETTTHPVDEGNTDETET